MPSKVLSARSKLGVAARRANPAEIAIARQELAAAKLEAYIAKVVAEAPELSAEQRDRITSLIHAGGVTA